MESQVLSPKEIRRYNCQISLPDVGLEGQETLKKSKVLVIGSGGKGSTVLQYLAAAGIGTLGISDNYPVEENKLCRQRLYGNSDLGKQKAIISKQHLQVINHMLEYRLHNVCLSDRNIMPISEPYDLLIDATDNFPARYLINDAAISQNKPFIFGSVLNSLGMVSVFNYKGGPSLRCLYPEVPSQTEKPSLEGLMSTGIATGMIGTVMANEAIKVLLGIDTQLNGNLLNINLSNYQTKVQAIKKQEKNFNISRFSIPSE